MTGARTDPWHCDTCGRPADLAGQALAVGLVRLAVDGEDGFRLGSEGVASDVAALLGPCACGGALVPGPGAGAPVAATFDADALAPVAARGWAVLEASREPRLRELAAVWRPRALLLLGRAGELAKEDVLRLKLEDRLASIAHDMEHARLAGDGDAAEALHARYIELGTTYVRRFVRGDARPASAG